MAPTIGWDENKPAGGDSLGVGDDEIRSLKTALRIGLGTEHVWPSAGGDAGVHALGSARPYIGTQSLVSSTGTDGRLFHASDSSNLFGVGSGGTTFLGGPTVISAGSFPGSLPQRAIWVEEFGYGKVISGSTVVTIPNSGYSGRPFVWLTAVDTSLIAATQGAWLAGAPTATQFTVAMDSADSFVWRSLGTRTL